VADLDASIPDPVDVGAHRLVAEANRATQPPRKRPRRPARRRQRRPQLRRRPARHPPLRLHQPPRHPPEPRTERRRTTSLPLPATEQRCRPARPSPVTDRPPSRPRCRRHRQGCRS
jgi:hypothetical protein